MENEIANMEDSLQTIGPIVATVENDREAGLERRLAEAEAAIAQLRAAAAQPQGRKTLAAGTASVLAKQGLTNDSLEAGAFDLALTSLSIEQRIAVKAELLRAGILR